MMRTFMIRRSFASAVPISTSTQAKVAVSADKIRPLFEDKFKEEDLERATIYSLTQSSLGTKYSTLLQMSGRRSSYAFGKLTGDGTGIIDRPVTRDIQLEGGNRAVGVFTPASHSSTGQDFVEVFAEPTGQMELVSKIKSLGSDFMEATDRNFVERVLKQEDRMATNMFSEVRELLRPVAEEERRESLRKFGLGLSVLYQSWKETCQQVTRLFSQQSFANESNIKQLATDQLSAVLTAMQQHLNDQRRVREFAGGINATIIGPPNAGKSTFLNLLCQKYVSTVSPQAGSTTDTIDKTLKIDGVPLALTDTVGLTAQSIGDKMQGGLLNTKNRMDSGDLKICLLDMSTIYQDKSQTAIDPAVLEAIDPDTIVLVNKRDLVNIRIPAPPGKIRYKNSPLSPQGEVQRTAFRGKVPIRLDGDTTGNFVKFGDFGLRVLHDVRLTERCLQECRATLHRYIKSVRGGRFWLRVVPDHPMSAKPIGVRMGKGKGAFDHWEAKVPCKKIVFEIGGGVREETARKIMRIVSARLPGKTEFVVAEKEEMVTDLISRIKEYSKLPPLGVWCISCETGEGVEEFLGDFSDLLRKRYEAALSDENQQPDSRRTLQLQQGVALKDQLSEKPPQMIAQQLIQHLDALIEKPTVKQAVDYLYHAKYGVLRKNEMQQQQQQ